MLAVPLRHGDRITFVSETCHSEFGGVKRPHTAGCVEQLISAVFKSFPAPRCAYPDKRLQAPSYVLLLIY